ncbi:glutamine synthetase family protein [Streptomyces sp. NPDC051018]|uniref:glutamine synthetase family protein n=1 Tax=Streptomyces sp. NPDC051018 TaxID=3365639 RepID=UPI0037B1D010
MTGPRAQQSGREGVPPRRTPAEAREAAGGFGPGRPAGPGGPGGLSGGPGGPGGPAGLPGGPGGLDGLRELVAAGAVDTVEVAAVDMQGRLPGRRLPARHFLDEVAESGLECQGYLLATDAGMSTPDGYAIASWETGYGNIVLRPDPATLRYAPWRDRTAIVLCDLATRDGAPVSVSPRQILRAQLDRLDALGLSALVGAELEFLLYATSYRQAWANGYRALEPVTHFGNDLNLLETGFGGTFLQGLMPELDRAGVPLEGLVGEANAGQYELVLRYTDALRACDNQAVGRFAVKQLAADHGLSATFMPKPGPGDGNSCHLHFSLRTHDGEPAFAGGGPHGFSPLMARFLAGQLTHLREFTLLFAPNINSYKRFAAASYAPTTVAWGFDNRTCALRVLGAGPSLRFEHRVPGGDVNAHLAVAAIIAAGLQGVEDGLELEEALTGNAYTSGRRPLPPTLAEAITSFRDSTAARKAFGQDTVDHYARAGEVELEAFSAAVTDWELTRGFERL